MDGASPPIQVLERIVLPAPLGIVFWDFVTGAPIGDGLSVSIAVKERPDASRELIVNRSAVWVAPSLPGVSANALATADWSTLRRPYQVTVTDTLGRFLPLTFEADFPSPGLYEWPGWAGLPLEPLSPLSLQDSPPAASYKRIPLFSAPSRTLPPGIAVVRSQLKDLVSGQPASWALVTATHNGVTLGIGLADGMGNASILFAYPERPPRTLANSPPAIPDYLWDLEIAAFCAPRPLAQTDIPDLADLLAQLEHPRDVLGSILSPMETLPTQSLKLHRPLVLRTARTPQGPSSFLFLGPD